MESLTLKEIIKSVKGKCPECNDISINNICTDSRKLSNGDLYIALAGERFDGHEFINEAVKKGAAAIIASKETDIKEVPVIIVEDTLFALGRIAFYYRSKMNIPVVAVTGSVGKTSTKDIIAQTLSSTLNVHRTTGNFNNEVGLPFTIFGIEKSHDVAVLEMGMWEKGEISYLTGIAKPSVAVITNIGISHIERLKTQENILNAKLEIVEGLAEDGLLILNGNDPLLRGVDKNIVKRIVYIGIDIQADYRAHSIIDNGENGISYKVEIAGVTYNVELSAIGTHNVHNSLAAIACAVELGIKPEDFLPALKDYKPNDMRLNLVKKDGIKFINDSYNASPDSMQAGLKALKSIAKKNRAIAIIGNMFELGEMAEKAHYSVGKMCNDLEIDFVAIMGENSSDVANGIGDNIPYEIFSTHEEIVKYMKDYLMPTDVVLIKGSRGMEMERVLELWN